MLQGVIIDFEIGQLNNTFQTLDLCQNLTLTWLNDKKKLRVPIKKNDIKIAYG
jgi:hypothetical protein